MAEVRRRLHTLTNEMQALQGHVELGELDQARAHSKRVNLALKKLVIAVELMEPD